MLLHDREIISKINELNLNELFKERIETRRKLSVLIHKRENDTFDESCFEEEDYSETNQDYIDVMNEDLNVIEYKNKNLLELISILEEHKPFKYISEIVDTCYRITTTGDIKYDMMESFTETCRFNRKCSYVLERIYEMRIQIKYFLEDQIDHDKICIDEFERDPDNFNENDVKYLNLCNSLNSEISIKELTKLYESNMNDELFMKYYEYARIRYPDLTMYEFVKMKLLSLWGIYLPFAHIKITDEDELYYIEY